MTNSTTTRPAAFQGFEQAAQWAVETVDAGRMDRFELYDFMKDLLEGRDMAAWHREENIRQELAQDVA